MILSIMQPYLFPYLGYFQLINSSNIFIMYDDVTYIKQGWINRNRILINGEPQFFTLPVEGNSFKQIKNIKISKSEYPKWKKKFFKTIEQNYSLAPNYDIIRNIIELSLSEELEYIVNIIYKSILIICDYLEIKTKIIESSNIYNNSNLHKENRIYDICKKENATLYINLIGGRELYSKEEFLKNNIELRFIKSDIENYNQLKTNIFIPNLSIIDVLMNNSKLNVQSMLTQYSLM